MWPLSPKRWCCESAALNMPANCQWPQDWKRSVFIPISKKGHAKECSNYRTVALISCTSEVILKILQARLQQYVNREFPDAQAGFRKGRGTGDQIANICWITEKEREFPKTSTSASLTTLKLLTVWITTDYGKFFKRWGLLRNLYAGQKATVITRHGTTHWFQNWERSTSSLYIVILLVYIMQNRGWMNHKLESRFPGEISTTSDTQMIPP